MNGCREIYCIAHLNRSMSRDNLAMSGMQSASYFVESGIRIKKLNKNIKTKKSFMKKEKQEIFICQK